MELKRKRKRISNIKINKSIQNENSEKKNLLFQLNLHCIDSIIFFLQSVDFCTSTD